MSTRHTVVQGECLSQIAKRHGFQNYRHLWDHADNQALREKRRNPNVLYPGDVVVIPDKESRSANCATGRTHTFEVARLSKELRVVFLDHRGSPLAALDYEIGCGGRSLAGKTDGEGKLLEKVPSDTKECTIAINGRVLSCRLGHLNPMEQVEAGDVSGLQARLRNLGYPAGTIDGRIGPKTRGAIAFFQADHDLKIDGDPGPRTSDRVEQEHGC